MTTTSFFFLLTAPASRRSEPMLFTNLDAAEETAMRLADYGGLDFQEIRQGVFEAAHGGETYRIDRLLPMDEPLDVW